MQNCYRTVIPANFLAPSPEIMLSLIQFSVCGCQDVPVGESSDLLARSSASLCCDGSPSESASAGCAERGKWEPRTEGASEKTLCAGCFEGEGASACQGVVDLGRQPEPSDPLAGRN